MRTTLPFGTRRNRIRWPDVNRRRRMTTLLLTHPACLDHATPPGHPERADRLRAIDEVLGGERFQFLQRELAPEASFDSDRTLSLRASRSARSAISRRRKASCTSTAIRRCRPAACEAILRSVGGAVAAADAVMTGKAEQRLRRHAPARPSRRGRQADGLLLLQQRGDRRAPRAAQARHRPRRDRRFRRASRQRHAGHLLGRQDGDVLLDPPDAAVSRHRRRERTRRARHHRQRADARRRRPRKIPRGVRDRDPAAAARISRRSSWSSRPASTRTIAIRSPTSRSKAPTTSG